MLPNRDTLETKEVTMADLVEMCQDCDQLCKRKTSRVLENRSRSPRGWEKEYDEVAKGFQSHEFQQCLQACSRVWRQCPAPDVVRAAHGETRDATPVPEPTSWWKFWKGKDLPRPTPPAAEGVSQVITENEMAICENAAGDFANVLFMLAHKPTKVQFHTYDPKTGDAYNPDTGEWLTRDKSAQASSKEVAAMLVDKWNTGLHGKQNARSAAIPDVSDDILMGKGGRPQVVQPPEDPNVHGTVPKF